MSGGIVSHGSSADNYYVILGNLNSTGFAVPWNSNAATKAAAIVFIKVTPANVAIANTTTGTEPCAATGK